MDDESDILRDAPPARLDVDVCRALGSEAVSFRADGDDESGEGGSDNSPGTLYGRFSTFGDWYEINSWFEGHFIERIAPGAFKRTLKNRSGETPIRVLLEHGFDPTVGDKPLGVASVLEERDDGPYAEVPLFDTSYNRDLAPALAAGAYGQSFRFQVLRDEWVEDVESEAHDASVPDKWRDLPQRTIHEVRVSEFGPTVFPANPMAEAGLRSTTDEFYEQLRRRDPESADRAIARCTKLRAPQSPQAATETPPADASADPQTGHAPEPAAARGTSEAPPEKHSAATTPTSNNKTRSTTMDESMTVEERVARQSEIRARLAEIDTEYAGAALPPETQAEWDGLRKEYDDHDVAIEAQERRRQELADVAAAEASDENGDFTVEARSRATERARPNAPAVSRKPANIYDLTAVRHEARSMDELPKLYRDRAMRAVEIARFPGVPDRARAQEQVERLLDSVDDEQGTLARRILTTGSPTYERAFGKVTSHLNVGALTAEEQRALSLGTDTAGGFAVPFQLDPTVILTSDGAIDPLRQIARVEQIVGKEWQGITSAGVTVSRSAEAAEVGDDTPSIAQPTVKAERVTGFVPFSMEIEQDWNALRNELTTMLNDAKMEEEADSFINGDGVAPNANGLLTEVSANGPSVVLTAAVNAFSSDDLYAMEEALPPRFRARAQWLANRSVYNAARKLGSTSDGGDLWVRLAQGLPPELIGYAAREGSEMPAFSTATGTDLAIFGDFRHFLIVDRVGMSIELVPHLLGANRRPTGQRGILAVWRNNSKTLVPGAFRVLQVDGV